MYIGCMILKAGTRLRPKYIIAYLGRNGWTTDVYLALPMTQQEAYAFKLRGMNRVWVRLRSELLEKVHG